MEEIRRKRKYGNPGMFVTYMVAGIALIAVAVIIFLSMFTVPKKATIIRTGKGNSGGYSYTVYDFTYEYNGNEYQGWGDDDDDTCEVGQTYTIYVHPINPGKYNFKNTNVACYVLTALFTLAGAVVLFITIKKHMLYLAILKEVGDANGDGTIDEHDILFHDRMLEGRAEGAHDASKENAYYEKKAELKCPYCDCIISINDKFCTSCGAPLGKEKK